MPNGQIDINSGLVPKSPAPGGVDISAGLVQQGQAQPTGWFDPQSGLMRGISAVGEQIKQPFQQTAEELSRLNRAAGQGQLFQQIRQDFPPAGSVGNVLGQVVDQYNPVVVKRDDQGNIDWPTTIGATAGKTASMAAPLFLGTPGEGAPGNVLSEGKYSPAADKIASSLKPSSGLDMPAVANRALPALKESFADLGGDTRSFQGREGTLLFKTTVQHAVDIAENRAGQVLAPILPDSANSQMLANSPDLVAYLGTDEDVTNAMVNQARKEANKVLTRGNYFLKPVSKQLAATDAVTDAFNVASQARNILYSAAQDATGYDLRPLRSMESDLINLADAATSTHNTLSGREASFQAAGVPARVIGSLKTAIAAKASPVSALSIGDQPGLFSPLKQFNSNMKDAFADVLPQAADTDMRIPARPSMPGFATGQLPPRTMVTPQPFAPPGYQLGPTGSTGTNFGQATVQGKPYIPPPNLPPALPGGAAPIYVEPTVAPPSRMLPKKGVPATRYAIAKSQSQP